MYYSTFITFFSKKSEVLNQAIYWDLMNLVNLENIQMIETFQQMVRPQPTFHKANSERLKLQSHWIIFIWCPSFCKNNYEKMLHTV